MSNALNDRCGTESSEEPNNREAQYGQKVYERLRSGQGFLTADQIESLVTAVMQSHPHHGRLFYVMRHVGLWLPVTLGLQIGDVERDPSLIRVARGWSDQGEYSIPRKDGRGFIQLGNHAPTLIPIAANVLMMIDAHIADLERDHHPTGTHDWLFPGRTSGHPWTPGAFSHVVLQPALRKLGLPPVTPKNLYFSIIRLRVQETMMEGATRRRAQPSPVCTDPSCPRQRSQSHTPIDGSRPLILDLPGPHRNPA